MSRKRLSECDDLEFLRNVAESLFDLLDEIDTTSDIAKSDDSWYRKRVEHLNRKRFDFGLNTDGYGLFYET